MTKLPHIILLTVLIAGLCPAESLAQGKLNAFEADTKTTNERKSNSTSRSDSHRSDSCRSDSHRSDSCLGSGFEEVFAELLVGTLVYGGACSLARVTDSEFSDDELSLRELGDPLISFARVDAAYQFVESDIEAFDLRAEVGYGPLGAHVNFTRFWEDSPSDKLDIVRILGLYRMSLGSYVEVDLGFGAITIDGDESDSRFLFACPILIHPNEYWGFEFRPAWADQVRDFDASIMLNLDYTSFKFGYRWLESPHESLNGPYIGFSIRL